VTAGLAFDDPSLAWLFTEEAPPEPTVAWLHADAAPALKRAAVVAPSRPVGTDEHCARYLLRTLAPLGIDLHWDDRPLGMEPKRSDEILLHPGSGSTAKNWPPECFAAVIRALSVPVGLIVGEADVAAATALEQAIGGRLPRIEGVALFDLATRLAGCRAYVGNDSGVSHLAGLCGARTVAVFGPTPASVWHPLGPDVHVVPFDTDPRAVAALLMR
jgi:hypothetical protein